jgi:DNA polymerase-3 subunit alpha
VSVLAPDINISRSDFTVFDGNIRFGLLAIRNVGRNFASAVVKERQKKPFNSFDEFVERLSGSDINKRTLESLIKCGVFDTLGISRSSLISCYEDILESVQNKARNNVSGQIDLFSMGDAFETAQGYDYPSVEEYSLKELLLLERESSGMYFSGHLIDDYTDHISIIKPCSISDILSDTDEANNSNTKKYSDKQSVKIAGIITAKKTKTVKNGDTMAFITVEDRLAEIEVIVFSRQYSKIQDELYIENAVSIEGNLSLEEGENAKIVLSSLTRLIANSDLPKVKPKSEEEIRIFIKVDTVNDPKLARLSRMSLLNPGKSSIVVFDASAKKYSVYKGGTIAPSDSVIDRLSSIFGEGNVIKK